MKLDILAFEIAVLSNQDLQKLAEILVKDYSLRADWLEQGLNNAMFEQELDLLEV